MNTDKLVHEFHVALQHAIKNWGRLLIATRGCLKPEKCFFHLLDFVWMAKRGWQYIPQHDDKSTVVAVPIPNGTMAPITHLAVDNAQNKLGVGTCPSGNSTGSLRQMKEKAQKWLDSLTAGRLHHRMVWFSIDRQLWPSIKYGLCCSMATLLELEDILLPFYENMLPLGGICQQSQPGDMTVVGPRLLRRGLASRPGLNKPISSLCSTDVIQPLALSCKHPSNF
jgi:hypothetical protein